MATEKKDTVILTTSDDENFTVERKVAERSVLIKSMLDGMYGALLLFAIPCIQLLCALPRRRPIPMKLQ